MNRIMVSVVLGGAAALGASAFANDAGTPTHQTRKELMQQCMELQKTQNSDATDKDMKKTCHEQVKMQIAQQRSQEDPSSTSSQPYPSATSPAPYNPPPSSSMPRP
jgi:hypothetical protein